jgi:P pilus assembly chaperone PapD
MDYGKGHWGMTVRARISASVHLGCLGVLVGACLSAAPAAAQAPAAPAPAAAAPATSDVGANLNISPKRLTFDVSKRSATVFIFNQGTAPATFDIAVVDRVMLPSGQIMPVAEAQAHPEYKSEVDRQKSAAGMILITPRRAVLAPGKGQTIRVRVAPDADAQGEYRSHLTVTTVPPRDLGTTADQAAAGNPGELRVIINSVFGISIPLIVRLGTPDIRAGIENAKLSYADISPDGIAAAKRTPVVTIDLVRSGANSLFGNVEIHSQTHGGNLIGIAKGVGVYTEIDRRTLRVPLTRAPEQGEVLQATFVDDDSAAGKLLAQATVAP